MDGRGDAADLLSDVTPSVSVAQVARPDAVNANMVLKWLRDPRYAPEVIPADTTIFLPVEIFDQHRKTALSPAPGSAPSAGTFKIDLAGGRWMRISGRYDREVLTRMTRRLTA